MVNSPDDYPGVPAVALETSADLVYASLRRAITDGTLVPGQRLIEARLAERLGVSRAPLREAMRVLASEGLVNNVPRRGVIVAILRKADAAEIYGLRIALETWAAREACRLASEADLAALRALVAEMEQSSEANDLEVLSGNDVIFHRRICEIAANHRLLRVWTGIHSQIRLLSRQVIGTLYADLHAVPKRHELIVEAIAERNPVLVETLVREHIESVAARILAQMTEAETKGRSGEVAV
jgi:DNA-binding GntR family transcriptional regulator